MNKQKLTKETPFPEFVDNLGENTLSEALKSILKDNINGSKYNEACIVTAFFTSAGFFQIVDELADIDSVRLLIGAEFFSKHLFPLKPLEKTKERFKTEQLQESLNSIEIGLQRERDHLSFDLQSEKKIRSFVKALQSRNIEIRRYEKKFLHAKAYIFIKQENEENEGVIIGSSNMTKAGLTTNLELNTSRCDKMTVSKAKSWFNQLWEDSVPFEVDKIFEELLKIQTPFDIFIRVLWQLYGKEIEVDSQKEEGLPLTHFQKHGVIRALRIIEEYGGVVVADEVGLGKTFIAAQIIEHYRNKKAKSFVNLSCDSS